MTNTNDAVRAARDGEPERHATWEQLNDLVDERLDAVASRAMELHLAECPACTAQRDALRALSADAGALPADVPPPEDLWNDVAASIAQRRQAQPVEAESQASALAPSVPLQALRSPRTLRFNAAGDSMRAPLPAATRAWLAAAAVLLMAISSGLTALYMRSAGTHAVTTASRPTPSTTPAGTALLPAAFVETERTYLASVAEVQSLLEAQRGVLAPATIETVDRALATIDAAIAEARAALLADPANRALAELLETNYRQKLDLLRRTAGLHQTS